MDDTFLFVVVIIAAIIFAIYLFNTTRKGRKRGSDQRNSSEGSDLSDFGSGHHGTGYDYVGDFGGGEKVTANCSKVIISRPPIIQGHSGPCSIGDDSTLVSFSTTKVQAPLAVLVYKNDCFLPYYVCYGV